MDVDWGAAKAAANERKHGVNFADAATVLHDELAITMRDDVAGEHRFVTLGIDALGRVLVVVHTWRGERPRLSASPRERRRYEERR